MTVTNGSEIYKFSAEIPYIDLCDILFIIVS